MNIIQYENYQEKREQDPSGFPYLTYPCTIPLDFSKVPLHWHDEMEFIYIKKGTGLVSVDFVPY
ncbi:MAG TPA: AraC family transcriptional regulator, partial [Clostridium sp.]|nr:AraC family transcriptional regulator [Clostridium sp.]